MEYLITQNENTIRMAVFFGMILLMGVSELLFQKKKPTQSKVKRWSHNFALVFSNSFLMKLILPIGSTAVGLIAIEKGWGLFNFLQTPKWLEIILTILIFDLLIYWQHRLMHKVPVLWRLHKVHHADPDLDVSSGSRFHPLEILLSIEIKFLAIILIGPPIIAIILFEILLNAFAMFNHANIRIPKVIDSALRIFIVTPDVHRIHHSTDVTETNSNFGFNIIWWDKIFSSYIAQPKLGHDKMKIGLENHPNPKDTIPIWSMWALIFKK